MFLFLRVLGFSVGTILIWTQAPWTLLFIVGLLFAAICGISFLPDVLDDIDLF